MRACFHQAGEADRRDHRAFEERRGYAGRILHDPEISVPPTGKQPGIRGYEQDERLLIRRDPGKLYDRGRDLSRQPLEEYQKRDRDQGFQNAVVKDGVALTKFYIWLEKQMAEGTQVTEISAARS